MSTVLRVMCLGLLLSSACVSPAPEVDETNQAICPEPPDCPPCYRNSGFGGCVCARVTCKTGQVCSPATDQCVPINPPTCPTGYADCDGNAANGCETSLSTVTNCGGCGIACAVPAGGSAVCVAAKCYYACSASQALICQ